MRQCPVPGCGRSPRWDENLSLLHVEGVGMWAACEHCHARARGEPPPEPRRYPKGGPIPKHPDRTTNDGTGDMPLCGLCRAALHEDEDAKGEHVRLYPADVAGLPQFAHVERGDAFAACRECMAVLRPRVARRLRLCGFLAADAPDDAARGRILL